MKKNDTICKELKENYGKNLKFADKFTDRKFEVGQLVTFQCGFKGTGAETALSYQDKRTVHLDHFIYRNVIVFKVIDKKDQTVTLREVNPFTGKFYKEARQIVCPMWREAEICGSKLVHRQKGEIIPAGPWEISGIIEKCWIPTEKYDGCELAGGCSYFGYVTDVYDGDIDCYKMNNGRMIAEYACIKAPKEVRKTPYKLQTKVIKLHKYTII